MGDLTELLQRVQAGEPGAREALFAAAYPELHRLAHARLFHGGRHTLLNTTALVHESFLRFQQAGRLQASERCGFFAYAAQVMRSVVIDLVRARQAERHGGELERVTLDSQLIDGLPGGDGGEVEILAVHEALRQLAETEPRLVQVVEMRYFGGFTEVEIADTLGLTERTVRRDWDKARLLLLALLA